jgi:peptidyl-prolyl cis-trans isomerase B (cyclophilin B)
MKKAFFSLSMFLLGVIIITTNCTPTKEGNKANMETEKTTEVKANNPHYLITITQNGKSLGEIELELFPDIAPKHVHNFDSLVAVKFYDGCAFHRVIPGFMIQGGDPNSKSKPMNTWGMGDPSQTRVPAEFNSTKHERGVISAARSNDPNSATSQFFLMHAASPHLDGQYSAYGKIVKGIEVVDAVCKVPMDGSAPKEKVEMTIVKISK